jgi:hypothetical protein
MPAPHFKSTKLQVPEHKQFFNTKAVQFLGGPCPATTPVLRIKSFTTGGSSNADKIPHRLHLRTFPRNKRCFRNVSHKVAFGNGSRYCAPGDLTEDSPSQVVSKNITAGISNGESGPISRPVTVKIAFRTDRGITDSRKSLFSISVLLGCSMSGHIRREGTSQDFLHD